jgi:hypothetical protein
LRPGMLITRKPVLQKSIFRCTWLQQNSLERTIPVSESS